MRRLADRRDLRLLLLGTEPLDEAGHRGPVDRAAPIGKTFPLRESEVRGLEADAAAGEFAGRSLHQSFEHPVTKHEQFEAGICRQLFGGLTLVAPIGNKDRPIGVEEHPTARATEPRQIPHVRGVGDEQALEVVLRQAGADTCKAARGRVGRILHSRRR